MGTFTLLVIACLSTFVVPVQSVNNIACYYGTWARYSGLKPEQIDATLCTSILVSFVQVSDNLLNIIPFDIGDENDVYPVFRSMRTNINTDLKIVLALGGATHDDSRFDRMIADAAILEQFSVNTVLQLRQWGMDGIDVDWEFPDNPEIHLTFIRALRKAIDDEALQPGDSRLELSGAMPAGSHYIVKYNIPEVGKILDVVYIMAYDYHGPWDSTTGHNSPLYGRQDDSNPLFNTEWTINHWYTEGIPKSKLYVGVPTYGRTFGLRDPSQFGVNVPANGQQLKTYGQACSQILSKSNALQFWDAESEVPYAVEGSTWLSFASIRSISNKCKWMDLNQFGGAMVWSLHQDDFAGVCGQGTFPLVRALKACSEDFPTPATPPTLPTTSPQTISTTLGTGFCAGKGDNSFHIVEYDCTKFVQCYAQVSYVQDCPTGLHFSATSKVCDFPSMAGRTDCDGMPMTEAPVTSESTTASTAAPSTASTAAPSTASTAVPRTGSTAATTVPTTAPSTAAPIIGTGQSLPKLACYYGTWARYSGLKPNQIDANLCTSILISFVQVRDDLIDITPFDNEDLSQVYPVLRNLRSISESGLKLVIALGGASNDNSKFDRMIADKSKLRAFAFNTVKTLRNWGMDGIDVDWEFPHKPQEHVEFLGALRAAIDGESLSGGNERLELSAALSAGSYIPNYDIPRIGTLLDIGYVMTYDYHGTWEDITGHNSPLLPRQDDVNKNLNTEWTMNHWYLNGFPKNKLYVGLPTYARQFTLTNPNINGVGAPFIGGGQKTYRDVCSEVLKTVSVTDVWDSESKVPYAFDGVTWTSYANVSSIATKCNWAVEQGFAGGMVWSLHQDDYDGICQQGTFPLIRALKACSDTFPTPPPLPLVPAPATVAPNNYCSGKSNGYFEVSGSCGSFIQCYGRQTYIKACTTGLHFSKSCSCCNFPSLAARIDCDSPATTTSTTVTAAPSTASTAAPSTASTAAPSTASTAAPPTTSTAASTSPTGAPPTAGSITGTGQSLPKLACYYGTWARFSGLKPEQIDANLCTTIIISFVQVRDDLIDIIPFNNDDISQVYPVLRNLRSMSESGFTLVIALGGALHDNTRFDRMIADKSKLRTFASNTVNTLRSWGMDGIDVDWEFPKKPQEHVEFLGAMRAAIDGESLSGGDKRLELSAALSAGSYIPNYDIPLVGSLLDIGYVMTYDYHGTWEDITGHNSPLFPRQDDVDKNLNTEWTMNHWYLKGFPKNKLYVGLPTYARQFTLTNPNINGVGAPFIGGGTKTYREVCSEILKTDTVTDVWDSESKVPYAYDGVTWTSYANISSIATKCNWAVDQGFAGGMVWSLESDDYDGICQQGTFPLIRALKACSDIFPTPRPTPATPSPPTVAPNNFCSGKSNGYYEVSGSCGSFIQCFGSKTYIKACTTGLHFSKSCTCCNFPSLAGRANCDSATTKDTTTTAIAPNNYCSGKSNGYYEVSGACDSFIQCFGSKTYIKACTTGLHFSKSCTCCNHPSLAGRANCDSTTTTTTTITPISTTTTATTTTSTSTSTSNPSGNRFAGRVEKIACYYGTWARYSGLKPENIDAELCSSVLVSFVQVRPDLLNIIPFEPSDINDVFPPIIAKKRQYGLKVIIALGGASHANGRFDSMIANPSTLAAFARNTLRTIRDWDMDGIDVDWEFPHDKAEHVTFMTAMRNAIDNEVRGFGVEKLELSAALPAGHYIMNYDIPAMGRLLDIGYVMAYDYHGPWESFTGHNSPLFPRQDDANQQLNTEWTVKHWIDNGLPAEKVYLGVPTYARTFRVADPQSTGVGVGVRAFGIQTLTHKQVCSNILSKPNTQMFWDGQSQVPYAVDGDIWVSYANGTSLAHKCSWADQLGLGGLMVWSLHQDDFDGVCDGNTHSLVRALKECSGTLPPTTPLPPLPTTTPTIPTTTTTRPPITGPVTETFCETRTSGFYEIPGDCINFVRCVNSVTYFFSCQAGLHFSLGCECCEFASEAGRTDCDQGSAAVIPEGMLIRQATTTHKPDVNFCAGRSDGNYAIPGVCSKYYTCSNGYTFKGLCQYPTLFNDRCDCCSNRISTLTIRDDCVI